MRFSTIFPTIKMLTFAYNESLEQTYYPDICFLYVECVISRFIVQYFPDFTAFFTVKQENASSRNCNRDLAKLLVSTNIISMMQNYFFLTIWHIRFTICSISLMAFVFVQVCSLLMIKYN